MEDILRILYVEDDIENQQDIKATLTGKTVNGHSIDIDCEGSFEEAASRSQYYNLVILDLFQGVATQGGKSVGDVVFEKVMKQIFVPIVFYSGNISSVKALRSQVVGVVSKGDGVKSLIQEIERLTKHNLPFLRNHIHNYVEHSLKMFFWSTIHKYNSLFTPSEDDYSLGYMLLRNFADSLSKEHIKEIIGDNSIDHEKVHPMEFYIYPPDPTKEYECGEIVKKKSDNEVFVILTPSCDFVKRRSGKRKVENVLLARAVLLTATREYSDYSSIKKDKKKIDEYKAQLDVVDEKERNNLNNNIEKLSNSIVSKTSSFDQFINSGKSDRYFFLPGTPFMDNRVIDFQNKEMTSYVSLKEDFDRITKLDDPFAQSMISSFIRYYNRIGFPDIDAEYIRLKLGI